MHGQYNTETVTGSLDHRSVLESSEQDQPKIHLKMSWMNQTLMI